MQLLELPIFMRAFDQGPPGDSSHYHYIVATEAATERSNGCTRQSAALPDGLSVGDAFGERFFGPLSEVRQRISQRVLPDSPWTYTDDTEMALSIVEILKEHASINQDQLANRFANRMQFQRGYGQGAYAVLCGVKDGLDWRHLTQIGFR